MRLSLRDYTTDELEALRTEVLQAIELAENPPVVEETPSPVPVCAADAAAAEPAATAPPASGPAPAVPVMAAPPAAVIRYMHPANRQLTWSGEGEVPEWITAYLARGGSWMAMENTAAKLAPQRKILR